MNCIKTMPKYAIRFAAYDVVKKWMRGPLVDPEKRKKPLSNRERFVAGGIAGMAGQALSFPLEVLKVRLSLRKTGEYRGVYDAIKKIYKTEGLRAFGNCTYNSRAG